MNKSLKERCKSKFYRQYLWCTALETDLLFFVVIDAVFLTTIKGLSMEQVSLLAFLSLVFSLVIQFPLLKGINRIGNNAAIRLGSITMLISAVCLTFAPNFAIMLIGGFMKCIAHTLNAMITAVLKNHLVNECKDNQFVTYQSDANSAASFAMMITSLLCGPLFKVYEYGPMIACIALSLVGVYVSFIMTNGEQSEREIITTTEMKKHIREQHRSGKYSNFVMFAAFAIFTALTGTGISYMKMNFQELLVGIGTESTVLLLSIISTVVYLIRILSNMMTSGFFDKNRNRVLLIVSGFLVVGMLLQILPWVPSIRGITPIVIVLLCTGYLMAAFVRDPFITLIQNLSLDLESKARQQSMLIALNSAKKVGALVLSAVCTILLDDSIIIYVMSLMTVVALINVFFCLRVIHKENML